MVYAGGIGFILILSKVNDTFMENKSNLCYYKKLEII